MTNTKSLKLQNLAKKHKPNTTWSNEARLQAVSQYLVLGNMALVSGITGYSPSTPALMESTALVERHGKRSSSDREY